MLFEKSQTKNLVKQRWSTKAHSLGWKLSLVQSRFVAAWAGWLASSRWASRCLAGEVSSFPKSLIIRIMAGRSGSGPGATDVFLAAFQKNIIHSIFNTICSFVHGLFLITTFIGKDKYVGKY